MSANLNNNIVRFLCQITVAALMVLTPSHAGAQTASPAQKSEAAPAGNIQNGKKLYASYGCYECHGYQAEGGAAGPRLARNLSPFADLSKYVRHPTGQMP